MPQHNHHPALSSVENWPHSLEGHMELTWIGDTLEEDLDYPSFAAGYLDLKGYEEGIGIGINGLALRNAQLDVYEKPSVRVRVTITYKKDDVANSYRNGVHYQDQLYRVIELAALDESH